MKSEMRHLHLGVWGSRGWGLGFGPGYELSCAGTWSTTCALIVTLIVTGTLHERNVHVLTMSLLLHSFFDCRPPPPLGRHSLTQQPIEKVEGAWMQLT